MEELTEDHVESLKQRREWVKFDEEANVKQQESNNDTRVHFQASSGEAAVIAVENGPKSTSPTTSSSGSSTNGLDDKVSKADSAVIETTQVHVSLDRHSLPTTDPLPSPAPRGSKDHSSRSFPSQQIPKAAARAHKNAAPSPKSEIPMSKSHVDANTATTSNSVTNSSTTSLQPGRSHQERNETTIIQMPLREGVAAAAAAVSAEAPPEMQNISLADSANGSLVTSVTLNQVRKNATRQAFANGDILVTVLPQNEKCPWLTRASFRPELVPEELMSQHLTLTVEDYLSAMEVLVNDFRFNCYNICYKRILMAWILMGFIVLLALLFSGVKGVALFGAGVIWLLLNASGIFVCMWIKIRLRYHLEGCVAQVNKYFLKHKIIMGVDDRGKLSCHKVNLIFVYFDCNDCVRKLNEIIDNEDKLRDGQTEDVQNNRRDTFHSRMDIGDSDIIITGNSNTRVSRQQERGERLLLRYSQRWVKEYVCKRLDLSVDCYDRQEGEPPIHPRHCLSARCPCQFVENHLRYKPRGKFCGCQFFDF